VKIIQATLYPLNIPFIETFSHSAKTRGSSDSFVVKLVAEDGTIGYGEGIARPYVTGETVEISVNHIKNVLWPAVQEAHFQEIDPSTDPLSLLKALTRLLPDETSTEVVAWNGARAAVELALLDCRLKAQKIPFGTLLPPKRNTVIYSGVITASSIQKAVQHAKHFKMFGLRQVKVKIGEGDDVSRIAALREALGPEVSIRVDANGSYRVDQAIETLHRLAPFQIDCIEQPIPRGNPADMALVKQHSPIPVMVDESLVTLEDARRLIDANACDFFNLRIAKCGGIAKTLAIAAIAQTAGIRLQVGCQVGETALLSAAGRHVAAHLDWVEFVEGSYGKLLLEEDLSNEPVQFGHGGKASILKGVGLGVSISEARLAQYATRRIDL
jgi:muconate cycloisomerase